MFFKLDDRSRREITEANINYYASPFVHPQRRMSEHDFIYMLEGELKIGQNDEKFILKKDSLLILNADNLHYGISPCLSESKTMYFHLKGLSSDLYSAEEQFGYLPSFIKADTNRSVKRLFREIVNAKLNSQERKASALFDLLLLELYASGADSADSSLGERIKKYIHQNPEKFFSNKEIAEMTGVSVKTAENKFKALFGITIHQYILKFKIEQAVSYFNTYPEMQIKEIAYNLGFYDEYHFSKQFKKVMGVSPLIYKKGL